MNNKIINYFTILVQSKNDTSKSTKLKITIILSIALFAILLFIISFCIYYVNTSQIEKVRDNRDKHLTEMMRINMGEIPNPPSVVKHKLASDIKSFLHNNNKDLDKHKKIEEYISKFIIIDSLQIHSISKKISENPGKDYNQFFANEKTKVTQEIIDIDEKIKKNNEQLKVIEKPLIDHPISKYNIRMNLNDNTIEFDSKGENYFKDTLAVKSPVKSPVKIDSLDSSKLSESFIEYNSLRDHKDNLIKENITLTEQRNIKNQNQISLETYRKNKAYIFFNQYNISKLSIDYCIQEGVKYFAYYHALLVVILVFTALMSLCIFGVSAKGWTNTDPFLKTITMCVIVVLGISNLINVVIKPKDNYISYFKKAENNENIQTEIVKFFNQYDSLDEKQIDELINNNFKNLTKFSEILPISDEEGLSKGITNFSELTDKK